jgi:hypothetical protein
MLKNYRKMQLLKFGNHCPRVLKWALFGLRVICLEPLSLPATPKETKKAISSHFV